MSRSPGRSPAGHLAIAAVGGLAFAASLACFAVSFATRFGVVLPSAGSSPLAPAAADVGLFSVFALHHSIFARTRLKAALTRVVPASLERTTYVWIASAIFAAVCVLWQPVPGLAWQLTGISAAVALALEVAAAVATIVAARQLGVLALAGVRQVLDEGRPAAAPILDDRGLYAVVRHPIYLAWFVLVWATPLMTGTRLTFAATSCAYLVAAVPFEERDLRHVFGPAYVDYARRVRWRILPWLY